MPHNFDSPLTITNGCISPTGPLELAPGETPVKLDVWVWQEGGGCVAVQRVFPGRKTPDVVERITWVANLDPKVDHRGAMFVAGPATAMALLVSETAGQPKTFQWVEGILLE